MKVYTEQREPDAPVPTHASGNSRPPESSFRRIWRPSRSGMSTAPSNAEKTISNPPPTARRAPRSQRVRARDVPEAGTRGPAALGPARMKDPEERRDPLEDHGGVRFGQPVGVDARHVARLYRPQVGPVRPARIGALVEAEAHPVDDELWVGEQNLGARQFRVGGRRIRADARATGELDEGLPKRAGSEGPVSVRIDRVGNQD